MVSGGRPPQPFVKDCDQHGSLVADGELVVARGDSAMPPQAVDAALDREALAVVGRVEIRRRR